MKTKYIVPALLIAVLPLSGLYAQDGGQLFKTNCGACHTVGKGKLVGPDLKNVQDRHAESWILKWVKSSQTLVKSGDKDAVKLFADNNQIPMPDQPTLTEDKIKSILTYIKSGGEAVTASAAKAAVTPGNSSGVDNITAATQKAAQDEKAGPSLLSTFGFTNYIVMFLIGLLLIVIWVLALAIQSLTEELKAKNCKVNY